MGARTLYPAPPCPACQKRANRVKNTKYTEDGRILRNRQCDWCEHSWWTLQTPEQNLDPLTQRVVFPSTFRKYKHHLATAIPEPCTPSQSSSA